MSTMKSCTCQLRDENGEVHITVAISSAGSSQLSHLRSIPSVSRTLGLLEDGPRARLSAKPKSVQCILFHSWLKNRKSQSRLFIFLPKNALQANELCYGSARQMGGK